MARKPRSKVKPTCDSPNLVHALQMYSTGSSYGQHLIFRPHDREQRRHYNLVDFPLPVGPVTSKIPCGRSIKPSNRLCVTGSIPSCWSVKRTLALSSKRITIPSPKSIGMTLTRTSICLPPTWNLMRPSCGTRRSAMFKLDRILMRLIIAAWNRCICAGIEASCNTPSMR